VLRNVNKCFPALLMREVVTHVIWTRPCTTNESRMVAHARRASIICQDECTTSSRKASQRVKTNVLPAHARRASVSRRMYYRLTQGEPVCQDECTTDSRKASQCVPSAPSRECKLTQGKPAQSTCPESTIVLVLVFCGSRLDSSSPMKHVASRFSIARRTLEES